MSIRIRTGTMWHAARKFVDPNFNPDHVRLPFRDFRRERQFLAPHVFAVPGAPGQERPTDLVSRESWSHISNLADDVALQTTNHQGRIVDLMHQVTSDWLFATPIDPQGAPYAPETSLLTTEEFEALNWIAISGYYRQAIGCLRNALEVMAHSAALAVTNDTTGFAAWRSGDDELSFTRSRQLIEGSDVGREIEAATDPISVFGDVTAGGWSANLYRRLCGYSHSAAGYNNADFWESNGPVYVPHAFDLVVDELRETVALCYVLLGLAWPALIVADDVKTRLLEPPTLTPWPETAKVVFNSTL